MDKHVEVLRRMENDIYSKHFRRRREALTAAIAALEAVGKAPIVEIRWRPHPMGWFIPRLTSGREQHALDVFEEHDKVLILPADAVGGE